MYRLLLLIPLTLLFLACDQAEPVVVTDWVVREVTKEVQVEVPVEVIVEVPIEVPVIVEVPVTPLGCPPSSEANWLVWSLEDARAMHLAWANYLSDYPPEEGTMLWKSVESAEAQLLKVAAYDRRLGIVAQFMEVCR